jgi:hypothetical protein
MESDSKRGWQHASGGQILVLTAVMLAIAALVAIAALCWRGKEMTNVALTVAAICYAASVLAILSENLLGGQNRLFGLLLSMAIRTGIPMGAAIFMKFAGGNYAKPEAIAYLLVFYFGALTTHVFLSYRAMNADPAPASREPFAK